MSNRNYELNAMSAKKAGPSGGGNYIKESGKYIGFFTNAECITSSTGAEGVEFTFMDSQERECNYLSIYTHNGKGEELPGNAMLMAIMACMKVRTATPSVVSLEKYNPLQKKKVMTNVTVLAELLNKNIGLLLREEEYLSKEQKIKKSMNIYMPFEATTDKTASEVLDQENASQLKGIHEWLIENPVKVLSDSERAKAMPTPAPQAPAMDQGAGGSFDQFDDDIPF